MNEILAPLGGYESLFAALNSGADAVYAGIKRFSARGNAENLSDGELESAVKECHKRSVKLYVTLNTLVYDSELAEFAECVKTAAVCGADGIIVQDIGAALLAKRICSDLPRHASTQMTLNSISGVKAAEKLGYSRVVIGRELSRGEIAEISSGTDMELEVFVHGALCVCVSGQCYMSAMFGGRSGNRGFCAQPCRLDFQCENRHNVISLKDSSIVSHLRDREMRSIASFKIEGRMKRPEYTACAVDACRKSLNGVDFDVRRLGGIFSRGGLTDGYYRADFTDMNGIRSKDDVDNSARALSGIKEIYRSEFPRIRVDIHAEIKIGAPIFVHAVCVFGDVSFTADIIPDTTENRALDESIVRERLSKLGGTVFYAGDITADVDNGLFVSAAGLNSVRRSVCGRLEELVLKKCTPQYNITDCTLPKPKQRGCNDNIVYRAEVCTLSQLREALGLDFDLIYAPMNILNGDIPDKNKIAVSPPLILSGCENDVRQCLERLRSDGFTEGYAQTLAHAELLKSCGFEIHGGYRMNILNSLSCEVCADCDFKDVTLSFEGTADMLSNISSPIPAGILAYGRIPLMLMRRCPIANGKPCGRYAGDGCGRIITDRRGTEFPMLCGGTGVELLNPDTLILSDKPSVLKRFDFVILKFTDEDKIAPILNMYKTSSKPQGKFTRGLYFRGVK